MRVAGMKSPVVSRFRVFGSAADRKFLHHPPQSRSGTSDRKAALKDILASAPLFPTRVSGLAAMYHARRKRGTSARIRPRREWALLCWRDKASARRNAFTKGFRASRAAALFLDSRALRPYLRSGLWHSRILSAKGFKNLHFQPEPRVSAATRKSWPRPSFVPCTTAWS